MDRIFFACDLYFLEEQVLPDDPVELVRKGILHGTELVDPWGRKYRYRRRNRTVSLKSFGADGVEGTSDDIVEEHALWSVGMPCRPDVARRWGVGEQRSRFY